MSGKIRTKERCPFGCQFDPDLAFFCTSHKTFPSRLYVDLSWKGQRIKVYSDAQGMTIDSYQRALLVQSVIDAEIRGKNFDPSRYIRQEQERFWTQTLLDRFLAARLPDLAPSYRKDYRRMVSVAAYFFGPKDVRELRKISLVDYKTHLESSGIGAKTVKNYLDHFKAFLRWCRSDLEIIAQVPAFPRVEQSPRPFRWLAAEDQLKIFAHIPKEDLPIIHFLALHGCRPAEARALRIRDFNLTAGTVTISSTFSGRVFREKRKGRGSRPYTLPIHPEMMEFMARRAGSALPGAWIFINPRNKGPYTENKLRRVWDAARTAAGLDSTLRLYDATRHSFASQLRAAGVGIESIRDHLGHSDIRTTLKYAHGTIEGMKANLERLSMKKVVSIFEPKTEAKEG
jgi:integrase